MGRLYGACVVFAAVLLICTVSFRINTETADALSGMLEDAYVYAQNGDTERSAGRMRDAVSYLDARSKTMCLFVSHRIIDDIRQETEKAEVYLQNGQTGLFLASCRSALFRTKDFLSLEYPTAGNIL